MAQKAQEGIDKIVARMDEIGVKSEMYDPVDKAIAIFGREPTKEDFYAIKMIDLRMIEAVFPLVVIQHNIIGKKTLMRYK